MNAEILQPLNKIQSRPFNFAHGRPNSGQGSLLFAKYAFAPNKLRYCGPDGNRDIFDYCVAEESDKGLIELLKGFEGAFPYLQLIAKANKIKDPFDEKVVEAYWIGNDLLKNVTTKDFHEQLKNRFSKKLSPNLMKWILPKPAEGAKPHHSFHVLDVYTKTGLIRSGIKTNVMETVDNCLILPGRVVKTKNEKLKTKNYNLKPKTIDNLTNQPFDDTPSSILRTGQGRPINQLTIQYHPIILKEGKLAFGELTTKEVISLFINPKVDDYVSIHWGNVCDELTARQLKNLQIWTKYHMEIANRTI
ncbi:MAG: hypothetical protein ACD_58C00119G0003 [uncultured bacterium]|nr:MAG: hypothetical protein ACD_58C00119G0003 [uncultured bacterium]